MKSTISKPSFYSYLSLTVFGTLFALNSGATGVKSYDGCISVYAPRVSIAPIYSSLNNLTKNPVAIFIKSDNGTFELPADNPILSIKTNGALYKYNKNTEYQIKPGTYNIAELITSRPADVQKQIDDNSTDILGRRLGMGFKDKKGNPFDVRVNGIPIFYSKERFRRFS